MGDYCDNVHTLIYVTGDISSKLSSNYEANPLEILDNIKEMFLW